MRPRTRRLALSSLLGAALVAVLAACRPLYIPLVPQSPTMPSYTRLDSSSGVAMVGGRPVLTLVLAEVVGPEGGDWLYVQWFSPSNVPAASDAEWVAADDAGRSIEFALPTDVDAVPGEWRAVVSHGAYVLRQFLLEVPVPGP